jgi:nitrate/nitrite-specific signal transduction histidine kinase
MHQLSNAARAMERGELNTAVLNTLLHRRVQDEVTKLAQVFKQMAEQVQLRERKLKQQVVDLRIQIDEQKKQEHVAEITETAYFQDLQQRAQALRNKRGRAGLNGSQPAQDTP